MSESLTRQLKFTKHAVRGKGVVVAQNVKAAEVGAEILRKGGKLLAVTNQKGELYPCSAWLTKSVATRCGSACASARIRLSVGPATMSMPTRPKRMRLASATYWLPGPTKISAFGSPKRPKVMAAMPCTPPMANMLSAPARWAA